MKKIKGLERNKKKIRNTYNPFLLSKNNWNTLVFSPSGSGMSVLSNCNTFIRLMEKNEQKSDKKKQRTPCSKGEIRKIFQKNIYN